MDWYVTYSDDIGNKPKSSNYYKETADNFTNVNYDDTDSDDFSFQRRKDALSFLGKDGIFSEKIPDFKVREGQLTMADAWQKCVNNESESVLVCEAGTGTGKTFSYLIPAILSGKTVVISTASKALQDQLVKKDLPRLFDLLQLPPDFMSLKGFNNYLCKRKYYEISEKFVNSHALKFEEVETENTSDEELLDLNEKSDLIKKEDLAKLELLIQRTEHQLELNTPQCDFAEVNSLFSKGVVSKVTCAGENCYKKKCPYYDECYPFMARQKAIRTKVVVINHSLFFADMQIENPFDVMQPSILLPKYRSIIFDEAHELPSIGREHLSESVGSSDLKKFEEDLKYMKKQFKCPVGIFENSYKKLYKAYRDLGAYLKTAEGGGENCRNLLYYKYNDYDENNTDPFYAYQHRNEKFRELAGNVYRALTDHLKVYKENKDLDEDFFARGCVYISCKLDTLVALMNIDCSDGTNPNYGKYVGTVTVRKKSYALSLTPLEIEEFFGPYLAQCEDHGISVLMTSATISVAGNFNKFLRDIGARKDTNCLTVKSSFDYQKQSLLYTSADFPTISDNSRILKIINMLSPLIESVDGGIFFLTTSHQALKSAYELLLAKFKGKRKILCQNGMLSNSQMLTKFKEDGRSILVGTSSFWAGVDVPGKALSLVIIDKLPFDSPSEPIFKARCDLFDAKNKGKSNHFISICIPEAVIELRQGVGRLIRHEDDKGGLVICDPRLENKSFGKIFKKSLPNMRTYTLLGDFTDAVKKLIS